jgi:hypothetical protein
MQLGDANLCVLGEVGAAVQRHHVQHRVHLPARAQRGEQARRRLQWPWAVKSLSCCPVCFVWRSPNEIDRAARK